MGRAGGDWRGWRGGRGRLCVLAVVLLRPARCPSGHLCRAADCDMQCVRGLVRAAAALRCAGRGFPPRPRPTHGCTATRSKAALRCGPLPAAASRVGMAGRPAMTDPPALPPPFTSPMTVPLSPSCGIDGGWRQRQNSDRRSARDPCADRAPGSCERIQAVRADDIAAARVPARASEASAVALAVGIAPRGDSSRFCQGGRRHAPARHALVRQCAHGVGLSPRAAQRRSADVAGLRRV